MSAEFILASGSPRRKELLTAVGLQYMVLVPIADESSVPKDMSVDLYVQELALLKAAAVAKVAVTRQDAVIIAADTIVALDGKILGKPKDEEDAFKMLKSLSGRKHDVYTGYCLLRERDAFTVSKSVRTEVYFKELDDDLIKRYIATGEPMDKAGAYGIQGKGSLLVEKIDGDYFNVVGLPISSLCDTLKNEFDIDLL